MCLSPTVYELLRRFEWNKLKANIPQASPLTAMNRAKKSLKDIETDLTFTVQQLKLMQEIPVPKDSMFFDMPVVREPQTIQQCGKLSDFMFNLNGHLHGSKPLDCKAQKTIFKIMLTVTLRQNLIQLSKHIYQQDEKAKKEQSESIIIDTVIQIIQKFIKQVEATTEDIVFAEFLSELLANLSTKSLTIHDLFHLQVSDVFNNDRFFKMNDSILRKWQVIMR